MENGLESLLKNDFFVWFLNFMIKSHTKSLLEMLKGNDIIRPNIRG